MARAFIEGDNMDRKQAHDTADRIRLTRLFDNFADGLAGEGFPDDEVTDCAFRWLCKRIGNRAEALDWAQDVINMWFDAEKTP